LKILVVTQFFEPENFRINDLIEELDERGHEVTVLTGLPNYPEGSFYEGFSYSSIGRSNKGKIKVVRSPVIPRFSSKKIQLAINYLSFAFFASLFGLFYCRDKYDVIFTYAPSPLTVALPSIFLNFFKRVKHVIWVQDLWPEVFTVVEAPKIKLFYDSVKLMMKFIYKRSNLILIQSKNFRTYILNLGVEDNKIIYFPNWAESFFKPMKISPTRRKKISLPGKDNFKIMFAGNIGAAQCFDIIVDAAIKVRSENISWIIVGDGRRKKWLENQIENFGLQENIFTLGRKPVKEMPEYYSLADAMLVSLEPHPVFSAWIPGKIQSYLACGKPIVALLSGAGAGVIRDSACGYAIESGTSEELAAKIKELSLLSADELSNMGKNALEYYDREFNRGKLISNLEYQFKKLS
tara:strand:- start:813 stop:2033 length:1221 start_codon:yes stop_codon:yes gene_type:complete